MELKIRMKILAKHNLFLALFQAPVLLGYCTICTYMQQYNYEMQGGMKIIHNHNNNNNNTVIIIMNSNTK